jgi:hypothetical protein
MTSKLRKVALSRKTEIHKRVTENADGCWIWNDCTSRAGYGVINIKKKVYYVHRLMAAIYYVEFEDVDHVMHDCDVRRCCNPDHLTLGNILLNNQDMFKKRRARPKGRIPNTYHGKAYDDDETEISHV